ncbi:unnamed protein product [Adineta steineri]|uniref:Uncharacterized protein n=1 Tax=Adineta steineri TaxID=433720 RepID=A0A814K5I3_9BILA|nr:unnamed protein product [Adineta steineri]CAF1260148.1 unnamed protein product [Adineta steineri]
MISNAEISIVLCNQGLEAIDIERFGRSIIIICKISTNGSSYNLIKNEYEKKEIQAQLKFAVLVRNAKPDADNLQGQLEWTEMFNLEKTLAETEQKLLNNRYTVEEYMKKRDASIKDIKNEKTKRDELLRKAQEVTNNIIEDKRIHDDLERRMKLINKERRDLLNEKKLQNIIDEMRRKATGNNDYDRVRQRMEELQISIAEQRQILSTKENE